MGKKKYILFRIIFLLSLMVNCGLAAYTNRELNNDNIELSPTGNAIETGLSSDNLPVFDGPAEQFYNFIITDLHESLTGIVDDSSAIHNFCISVWHPPENS